MTQLVFEIDPAPERFALAKTREFYEIWNRLRGDAKAPRASELDLIDFTEFLPTMSLIDLGDGEDEMSPRFWGTDLADRLGSDATGLDPSDFDRSDFLENSMKIVKECRTNVAPVWRCPNPLAVADKAHHVFESLSLPLIADDEEKVVCILAWLGFGAVSSEDLTILMSRVEQPVWRRG